MSMILGFLMGFCYETPLEWQHERWQKTIAILENQPISISNAYGDIFLRTSDSLEMEVIIHIQTLKKDPSAVKISHENEAGVLHLNLFFPKNESGQEQDLSMFEKNRRVDVTCFVPKNLLLTVTGKDGNLNGKGLDNPMTVSTQNGAVVLRNKQGASIKTYQGAIEYFLSSPDWAGELVLQSTVGSITYWVPAGSDSEIGAKTRGDICSDFSMQIQSAPNEMMKQSSIVLGSGTRKVTIDTEQGNVRIKKQIENSSY